MLLPLFFFFCYQTCRLYLSADYNDDDNNNNNNTAATTTTTAAATATTTATTTIINNNNNNNNTNKDRGTGMPDGVFDYHLQDSNRLVEEFMLMANMAVAKKIHVLYPNHAMLRNHPTPKEVPLEKLSQELAFAGIKIETSSAGALQKSLEHVGATTNKKTLLALQLMVTM